MAKAKEKKAEKPPEAEAGAEGEAPAKKKLAGKTLILFIALPALLILGGGGAAAYFLLSGPKAEAHAEAGEPGDDHGKEKKEKKDKKKDDKHAKKDAHGKEGEGGAAVSVSEGDGVYYLTMPEMLVNVANADGRPAFLKLKLTIEAPDEDVVAAIEPELPRVTDQFQAFLRELRVDDLTGSAGAYRLRLELLRRVNLAIAPSQANAVLIEEMLIQ